MGLMFISSRSQVRKTERDEESERVLDALEEYLKEHKEELIGALLIFWADQKTALVPDEVQAMIENKEVSAPLLKAWGQDYSHLAKKILKPVWEGALEKGRKTAEGSKYLREIPENSAFLDVNTLVLKWIRKHGAELVTNSTEAQKQAIQWLLAESVNQKMSAEQLAARIRQTIGLTKPQTVANQRYYINVLNMLKKEHPDMEEKAVLQRAYTAAEKYRQKQLKSRAFTIARTEIAMAYNRGQDAAVRYYIKLGFMGPKVKKIFVAARGDRACKRCKELDGKSANMDEDITTVYSQIVRGKKLRRTAGTYIPPVHPCCACSLKYEEVKED